MSVSEDELEQRLRSLFADERLELVPSQDAEQAILAGAHRVRRRHRVMTAVSGAAAVVVVAGAGVTVLKLQTADSSADMSTADQPPELSTRLPAPVSPSGGPPPAASSSPVEPSHTGVPPPVTQGNPPPRKTPRPTPTPTQAESGPVFSGPLLSTTGFGRLKLGMSAADASAQGVNLGEGQSNGPCTSYSIGGPGVPGGGSTVISASNGVVSISPSPVAHTAEGIGKGSTSEDIKGAYQWVSPASGGYTASVGENSTFRFTVDNDKVTFVGLTVTTNNDCAG